MFKISLRIIAGFSLIVAIAMMAINLPIAAAQGKCLDASAMLSVEYPLVGLVNQARASLGTEPLALNAELTAAAQRHSNDMARNQNFSHVGTDGSEFWDRTAAARYVGVPRGENVLIRFDLFWDGAFTQWWDSDGHRKNMLDSGSNEVGVAIQCGLYQGNVAYYYTMVLGFGAGTGEKPVPLGHGGGFIGPDPTVEPVGNPLPVPPPTTAPENKGGTAGDPVIVVAGDAALGMQLPSGWGYRDFIKETGAFLFGDSKEAMDARQKKLRQEPSVLVGVSGYFGIYSAAQYQITPQTDMVAMIQSWGAGFGKVLEEPKALTTISNGRGATVLVQENGLHSLYFVILFEQDKLVYGSVTGSPADIQKNSEAIYAALGTISVPAMGN